MKALETRRESESWQESEEPQSQHPRDAVSEWLGRKPYLEKTGKNNPKLVVKFTGQQGRANFHQGPFEITPKSFHACDLTALWIETQNRMDFCELKLTNPLTDYSPSAAPVYESKIVRDFNERAERWRRDTSFQSSLVAKFMHDDYQTIMAMGEIAIPLILSRLKKAPEHWFWALKHLAKGYDAAEGVDNPVDAAKAWLRWGKEEKGYRF